MVTFNSADMRVVFVCVLRILSVAPLVSSHQHHVPRQQTWNTSTPTIDLGYATYRGVRSNTGVDQYLGMRFAQAPLGELRFRAPQDPLLESEVQDASKVSKSARSLERRVSFASKKANTASQFSPLCIGVGQDASSPTYSEDCLFVNVFTPSNATPNSKLPVWLFIQGGGYATLGQFFNGTEVVRQSGGNIIFVNFNYRLGALGFLTSEKVRADGDLNAGLLDQRKVLYWVQDHIAKVPNNVTLPNQNKMPRLADKNHSLVVIPDTL